MLFIDKDGNKPEFLQQRLSVEEIEALELLSLAEADGVPVIPFGFMNADWRKFQALAQSGDEFWSFCSPLQYWDALRGSAGYVLIRDGRVIASLTTMRN